MSPWQSVGLRKTSIIFILFLVWSQVAHAQWEHIQAYWEGEDGIHQIVTRNTPEHSLDFFLTPSEERDSTHSLCLGCDNSGHRVGLSDFKIETSQRTVGQYQGKDILQIILTFRLSPAIEQLYAKQAGAEHPGEAVSSQASEKPVSVWKSIIMETSPKMYRELYFLVDSGTWIEPLSNAGLVDAGLSPVMETMDMMNFNAGACTEGYWAMTPSGPWLIDFDPVVKEIARRAPAGMVARQTGCYTLSMEKLQMGSPLQAKSATCNTCTLGTLVVHFKIDGHTAVPVSSSFVAEKD